jgi:hypothetical protein
MLLVSCLNLLLLVGVPRPNSLGMILLKSVVKGSMLRVAIVGSSGSALASSRSAWVVLVLLPKGKWMLGKI